MPDIVTQTFLIKGYFPDSSFPDWIIRRATLLDISGWVKSHSPRLIEIYASGNPILLDAMEVACSLGPIDARVSSIDIKQEHTPENHCRQTARFIRYSPSGTITER